jgi:hypothetical protein
MSNRKWAVGKFRAALPITNRLRFGSGVQPLAQSPSRRNSSAAQNDGRVGVGPRRRHLNSPKLANPGGQSVAALDIGPRLRTRGVTLRRQGLTDEQVIKAAGSPSLPHAG